MPILYIPCMSAEASSAIRKVVVPSTAISGNVVASALSSRRYSTMRTLRSSKEDENKEQSGEFVDIRLSLRENNVKSRCGETRNERLTASNSSVTFPPSHQSIAPTIAWMGTIHDFLRPSLTEKKESTIGLQRSLRE